jgi:hypothetical protein
VQSSAAATPPQGVASIPEEDDYKCAGKPNERCKKAVLGKKEK